MPHDPGSNEVPEGYVVLWYGQEPDIPQGWVLCDGENGTPDLRGRFVKGASDYSISGSVVGENEVQLSASQLPPHDHGEPGTESAGEHAHAYNPNHYVSTEGERNGIQHDIDSNEESASWSASGTHGHGMTIETAGSGDPIENRPEHVRGLHIKKT